MSIGKSQAEALAENFFDDLGSGSPDDLQPRETLSELFLLAGELIEDAQDFLNATRSNASGELSKSIEIRDPITSQGLIQVDIEMNFYGQFVNKGVKGVKGGSGLYSFKSEFPGKSMVKAIEEYMKTARSKIGNVKKGFEIGHEVKNRSVSEAASAYAMARSIKRHGIKPVFFMDKAIDNTDKKAEERFANALEIDVLNSLPDDLDNPEKQS